MQACVSICIRSRFVPHNKTHPMARVATVFCFIGEHQACPREKYVKNHLIDHGSWVLTSLVCKLFRQSNRGNMAFASPLLSTELPTVALTPIQRILSKFLTIRCAP